MKNDNGVILTIGCICNGEPFQLVMPLATDSSTLTDSNLCQDAVLSFDPGILPDLVPVMSSDAYVAFLQAVGMRPNKIPFRQPYQPTVYPGTAPAGAIPNQDAAIGAIYQDPNDLAAGQKRIRQARTFFAGLAHEQVSGNVITSTLASSIITVMNDLQGGWTSVADGSYNWYRVLDVPKPTSVSQPIRRLIAVEVRGSIYTQKRRVVPRLS
jgi:hypothetical protein